MVHSVEIGFKYLQLASRDSSNEKLTTDTHSSPVRMSYGVCFVSSNYGGWFNIKILSYQYRKSHYGDKTILWPSYLHNGISYTGKTTSLYWIRALISICFSSVISVLHVTLCYIGLGLVIMGLHCLISLQHMKSFDGDIYGANFKRKSTHTKCK